MFCCWKDRSQLVVNEMPRSESSWQEAKGIRWIVKYINKFQNKIFFLFLQSNI